MTIKQEIERCNQTLGRDLGRIDDGRPLYKWLHSEAPEMMHPMWTGDFEYHANTDSGLILPEPVYTLRKMCLNADDQWVLCHWIESPSEYEWRQSFGCALEWPKKGQYYPTNVKLDPGVWPEESVTAAVIECIRELRGKSPEQEAREFSDATDKREEKQKERLYEEIREECTTYDHVPGARDQVSYPAREQNEEQTNKVCLA